MLDLVDSSYRFVQRDFARKAFASFNQERERRKEKLDVRVCSLGVEKDRVNIVEKFNEKIEDSKQKLAEEQKNEKKWSVLDEHMVEKGADMQNWDTKEESSDNWDDDVDL